MKLKQTRYGAKLYLKFGVQIMDKNGLKWMVMDENIDFMKMDEIHP